MTLPLPQLQQNVINICILEKSVIFHRYFRGADQYHNVCFTATVFCTNYTFNWFSCQDGDQNFAWYDLTLVISSKENGETVSHVYILHCQENSNLCTEVFCILKQVKCMQEILNGWSWPSVHIICINSRDFLKNKQMWSISNKVKFFAAQAVLSLLHAVTSRTPCFVCWYNQCDCTSSLCVELLFVSIPGFHRSVIKSMCEHLPKTNYATSTVTQDT